MRVDDDGDYDDEAADAGDVIERKRPSRRRRRWQSSSKEAGTSNQAQGVDLIISLFFIWVPLAAGFIVIYHFISNRLCSCVQVDSCRLALE